MIVQSVTTITDKILSDTVFRVYRQVVDEKTRKVYYEFEIYTRKGVVETYKDKVHQVDVKV